VIPRRLNLICRRPEHSVCSIFVGGTSRKYNRDEIVGVFIREKVWLENSLSQSEGGGGSEQRNGLWRAKTPCGGLYYLCIFSLVIGRHFWYCVLPAFCWVGHMLSGCKVCFQSVWVYHWSWRSVYHPTAQFPYPDTTPFLPHIRTTGLHLGSLPSTACFSTRTRPLPAPLLQIGSGYFRAKTFPVEILQQSHPSYSSNR